MLEAGMHVDASFHDDADLLGWLSSLLREERGEGDSLVQEMEAFLEAEGRGTPEWYATMESLMEDAITELGDHVPAGHFFGWNPDWPGNLGVWPEEEDEQ